MEGLGPPTAVQPAGLGVARPPAPVATSDLPPLATKDQIRHKLGKGSGKVSDVCDVAIKHMKNTWVKLDERVPENYSWLKYATKKLRDAHDPVRTARCSIPRLGFSLVTLWGLFFLALEIYYYDSIANIGAGAVLFLLALFVTVYLGGDIFMFEAFRAIVDNLGWQIDVLKASRVFYQQKLEDLKDVSAGLENVQGQMSGDIDATITLLTDMERLCKLRTVTSVVNLFHQADYDDNMTICGEQAELLLPHLTILWEIVPGFDQQAVVEHVRKNGMTIKQFYPIVDALVQENEELALRALEDLLDQTAEEIAGNLVSTNNNDPAPDSEQQGGRPALLAPEAAHMAPPPRPSIGSSGGRGLDVEAGALPAPARAPEMLHGTAPTMPSSTASGSVGRQRSFSEGAPEELKPLCSVPTGIPIVPLCGFLEVGGNFSVWGKLHLVTLICLPFSVLILIFCIVEGEMIYTVTAAMLVCFNLALTGTGKLVKIVRVMRRQLEDLTSENQKLRDVNDGLAIQVAKLQKLAQGYLQLQTLCEGNVEKAKELLAKSNAKSKMEAIGLVTRHFKMYDPEKNFKLTESQKDEFLVDLEQLFRHLPGFDMDKIKEIVGPGEMRLSHKKIEEIVDVIVAFGDERTQRSGAARAAETMVLLPPASSGAAEAAGRSGAAAAPRTPVSSGAAEAAGRPGAAATPPRARPPRGAPPAPAAESFTCCLPAESTASSSSSSRATSASSASCLPR